MEADNAPVPIAKVERYASSPLKKDTSTNDVQEANSLPAKGDVDALMRAFSHRTRTGISLTESQQEAELRALMGDIFDDAESRKAVGVIWKNLSVKGVGIGVSMNQTFGGLFLTPFRKIHAKISHRIDPSRAQRTLLHDFTGCVQDGEMLLVLGRPGSGCTTFLKTIANQIEGFESVEGDITYGCLSAKEVKRKYRGEVMYNQEDDIHYAALTVKQTLAFALKMRTPKQLPAGMSQAQYRSTFLNILAKIFGIQHTLNTLVGNEVHSFIS